MNRTLVTTLCLALSTLAALPALAQPGGRGRGGPHGRGGPGGGVEQLANPDRIDGIAERIGLDDATVKRIKDIVYDAHKEEIQLKAAMKTARVDLRRALDDDAPDRAKVMRLVERVGDAGVKHQQHRIGTMLDIRALLTPDQVKQLAQMRRERRMHRKKERKSRRERRDED
jgi:Spy/CpxP family protein refolding chaperone